MPLYVQDFMTDEKLANCTAESTGVYIRMMCLMHKSQEYGKIILRDKFKIKSKSLANFSTMLMRQMPYSFEEIERSLEELVNEGVVVVDGDTLYQPRMVRDGELSDARSKAGSAGGKATKNNPKKKNYNERGFLYVAEDCNDNQCHKIGITKDLRNRLNGLRSKSQRDMKFVFTAETDDMGATEDSILTMLDDIRDGEWIYGIPLSEIMVVVEKVLKIKSKSKANQKQITENEIEDEIEIEIVNKSEGDNPFSGDLADAFDDWIAYKKEKRQSYQPRGLKSLITQIRRYADQFGESETANAIRNSMASNYQGIVFDQISKSGNGTAKTQQKKKKTFLDLYMEDES